MSARLVGQDGKLAPPPVPLEDVGRLEVILPVYDGDTGEQYPVRLHVPIEELVGLSGIEFQMEFETATKRRQGVISPNPPKES